MEWQPIETLHPLQKAILGRRGVDPEIGYWPGVLKNSNEEFPPTHWMPISCLPDLPSSKEV